MVELSTYIDCLASYIFSRQEFIIEVCMRHLIYNCRVFGFNLSSNYRITGRCIEDLAVPDVTFTYEGEGNYSQKSLFDKPAYTSPSFTDKGDPHISLYKLRDLCILHFADNSDFYLQPDHIIAQLLNPACLHWIELHLLGSVFSTWMELKGIRALHASAVKVRDYAVAFLATKEGGKSTIAAFFVKNRHQFITDDILPVEQNRGIFLGRPSYPQMKMWPEGAFHFLGHYIDLEPVLPMDPYYTKRKVPIGSNGFGTFCDQSMPLAAIYVPKREDTLDPCIKIESISPRDGMIELIRNSFSAGIVEALGLEEQRMRFFANMASKIPMRRLSYPSGFQHLAEVRDAIIADLEEL